MDWGKVVLLTSGIGIQQKSPLSFGWFNQLVSCQFLFVPFNSDHNRNEDQMLFAGWMIWCLDEEVLKKLISLCWHQFDWRARGWLCRLWRPPCHCWPLSSRSKHSSLRALSPQSVSLVLTWPTGTIHHLTLRSASSSLRQTLFKWGLKKFHSQNPSKQNKHLRYLIFGLFLYEKTYSKHEFPAALGREESTKQNNKQVVGWSESTSTPALSVMMYDVNTNIVTVATSLISSAQQSTLQTCPSN